MPRRELVTSPELPLNSVLTARFDDGSWLRIKLDIHGYHVQGGRPYFECSTKADLDLKLGLIAEDRGGLSFLRVEG